MDQYTLECGAPGVMCPACEERTVRPGEELCLWCKPNPPKYQNDVEFVGLANTRVKAGSHHDRLPGAWMANPRTLIPIPEEEETSRAIAPHEMLPSERRRWR